MVIGEWVGSPKRLASAHVVSDNGRLVRVKKKRRTPEGAFLQTKGIREK